jgi:3-oxoacyl-[acyl-carrier-protein] synthase II
MPYSSQRVVITGLGVISPIGCELETFWDSLAGSRSGIALIQSLPAGILPVRYGAEATRFTGAIEDFGPMDKNLQRNIRKGQKVMCREIEMGVAACQWALHDSGLASGVRDPHRIGIVYGSDYILTRPEEFEDGVRTCEEEARKHGHDFQIRDWPNLGLPKVNPLWLLKYLPNMPASHVAIYNDLQGPSNSITNREASNNLCIAEAMATIRRGAADAMLVGSTGSHIHPIRSLHISMQTQLARDREDPTQMARPFDTGRDGMVLGEGAGAMVLESLDSAQKRGARIWAEVVAYGASTVGRGGHSRPTYLAVANALRVLLARSQGNWPSQWHYHAMGSSQLTGDRDEAQAFRDVLGDAADRIPVASAKSYFGNLGAGSAAVEIIASCLALHHGKLFPTLNLSQLDPDCPIMARNQFQTPGDAFLHLNYTPQGQASGVAIRRFQP